MYIAPSSDYLLQTLNLPFKSDSKEVWCFWCLEWEWSIFQKRWLHSNPKSKLFNQIWRVVDQWIKTVILQTLMHNHFHVQILLNHGYNIYTILEFYNSKYTISWLMFTHAVQGSSASWCIYFEFVFPKQWTCFVYFFLFMLQSHLHV